jgi:hypothetical protein
MTTTTTRLPERREALAETGREPLFTTKQLAAYYGVDRWTVNEWLKAGMPKEPVRIKRGHRFDLDRVKAWMAGELTQAA